MREIIIPLATGIALFLFGMHLMRIGLMKISGKHLHRFLYRFTKTPYHGFFSGAVATLLLQSSSAVTVITIGLINAEMMTFYQGLGIILGANLGTVATVELVALNIGKWAVPLLLTGFLFVLYPSEKWRGFGLFLGGLSTIFLGMDALQMISIPIQRLPVMNTITSMPDHEIMIGLLFGLFVTSIIQSSSATIALTMGIIYNQGISLPLGIAIVLGSNIGTCITAVLASFGGNAEGKQVATAHLLLNFLGITLFLPFIGPFSDLIQMLTSSPPVQIAHTQLVFNLISSLIVLPFVKPFAKLTLLLSPK